MRTLPISQVTRSRTSLLLDSFQISIARFEARRFIKTNREKQNGNYGEKLLDGTLNQPTLGRWLSPIHTQRMAHIAYKHKTKAYIRQSNRDYQLCRSLPYDGNTWISTTRHFQWDQLPSSCIPIEIKYEGQEQWKQVAQSSIVPALKWAHTISTFDDFIANLEPWESDLLQGTEILMDP